MAKLIEKWDETTWQGQALMVVPFKSPLGLVLRAILKVNNMPDPEDAMKRPCYPRLGYGARITPSGILVAKYAETEGRHTWRDGIVVGTIDQVVGAFRKLADDLKLADRDRVAMFQTLRDWVDIDKRVKVQPSLGDGIDNAKQN